MRLSRAGVRILLLALVLTFAFTTPASAAPEGTMTWGVHITLASRWLDPAETEGIITPFMVLYALHDALVKPMPAGINTPSLAESFTASKDGLTYEFVIRKGVKFHNGDPVTAADVKFSFERYKGSGSRLLKERVREVQLVDREPRALRAEGAVARLHDVLRHVRDRRGLDRAEGVRREGRRRRVQEGADRRRPVQVRQLQPGHRAGDGSVGRLLAQDAEHQAARVPQHAGGDDARRRAEEGRGRHRLPAHRPRGRGHPALARLQARGAEGVAGHVLARPARPVGSEIAVARQARAPGG